MAATYETQHATAEASTAERALRFAWVTRQVVKHTALIGRRRLAVMGYRLRMGIRRLS